VDSISKKKFIPFRPSLFRKIQKNYCFMQRPIVKIWF
jgi:hypothetical protein